MRVLKLALRVLVVLAVAVMGHQEVRALRVQVQLTLAAVEAVAETIMLVAQAVLELLF